MTPGGDEAVAEIVGCARRTLAALSARVAYRYDWNVSRARPQTSPGPVGGLVKLVGQAVWERVSGGKAFGHGAADGFIEPATGRYMIDFGSYAMLCTDGVTYGGLSGRWLQTLRPDKREGEVLWLLRLIPGTTGARLEGTETLRGTLCRNYTISVDVRRAAADGGRAGLPTPTGVSSALPPVLVLTVWIDSENVRQVRFEDRTKSPQTTLDASSAKVLTLELWDFGVPVRELDWSRLPTFRTPAPSSSQASGTQGQSPDPGSNLAG